MKGARGLLSLRRIELVWFGLNIVGWQLAWRLSLESVQVWSRASSLLYVGLAIANVLLLVPFLDGRRGTPAEGMARLALGLAGGWVAFEVITMVRLFGGPSFLSGERATENLLHVAQMLLGVGAEVCFWLALARSRATEEKRTPIYFGLLAGATAIGFLSVVLSRESYRSLFTSMLGSVLNWTRVGMSAIAQVLVILVLRELVQRTATTDPAAAAEAPQPPSGFRDLLIGSIWLVGGVLITLVSYSVASAAGGGRFVITSGAIVYGLVRIVRGFSRL
jgi:hypothetical protein